MDKRLKRGFVVFTAVVVVFCAVGVIVGNFFFNLALNPHADKTAVYESVDNEFEIDMVAYNAGLDWFHGIGFEQTYMQSHDDLALHAWVLENPATDKWVITNHGYEGSASQLSYVAQEFYDHGYSILMPNARGHGRSEGDYYGMGWHDRLDLLDWAEYLNRTYGEIEIVLYGISMGGTTVLMASGEEALPANVTAIVSDSAYASVYGEFAYQLKSLFNLPSVPVLNFASLVAKVRAGYWFEEGNAITQVQSNTTPTLLIHGDSDTFVPPAMADDLFEACATNEKRLVIFESAGHGESSSVDGENYWKLVFSFLDEYVAA